MTRLTLPLLPPHIRTLTNEERARLMAIEDSLPSSPDDCPTCRGKKIFRWFDDEGQEAEYDCPCRDQFVLNRFLWYYGFKDQYQRWSWLDVLKALEVKAQEVALDYLDNLESYKDNGIGLLFRGTTGSGKTLLAILLSKAIIERGHTVYFATEHDVIDRFQSSWSSDQEKAWFERHLKNADFLVIDDLNRRQRQGSRAKDKDSVPADLRDNMMSNLLDNILRSRIASNKPTFVTTSQTIEEISRRYLSNIASLIQHSSIEHVFTGGNYYEQSVANKIDEARRKLRRPIVLG